MTNLAPVVLALLAAMADPPSPVDVVAALETALGDAIAKAEPSVVAIAREKDGKNEATTAVRGLFPARPERDGLNPNFFDPNRLQFEELIPDYIASDYASGVVIGDRGQILTTAHAVKGASRLVVRAEGGQVFDAEVIASDPRSDLAVIVPRELPTQRRPTLRPIAVAPTKTLRKGTFLLALGNPFNSGRDGQASASWGILANTSRRLNTLPSEPTYNHHLRHFPTLYQLDAKLNLGMSGGAVVDLRGELVGLTTNAINAGGFDAQAGYAIPIDRIASRVIEALKQGKEVEYGFLGIGLSEDRTNRINIVQPGTPAGEGGLLVNDVVTAIGGLPVVDADSLVTTVNVFAPGTPIKLAILRNGVEMEKTVILSKLPVSGEVIATNRPSSWRGLRVDFVSTLANGPFNNGVLDAMARGGVRVVEVKPGTPAEDSGLKFGQIIIEVEGQTVRTPTEFAKAVSAQPGPVTLLLEANQKVTVPVK